LVVVCIGTDRSTGDALGPLVGTILKDSGEFVGRLLGTLDEPVHAGNLKETLSTLADDNQRRMVLAIDACLGQSQQVGTICVGTGPIRPGAGVNKDLPLVGDLHVTGTVNVGGFMEYLVLQNTRLSLVLRMARAIARGLAAAVAEFPRVVSPGGAAPHQ
jgi:putative sporulation protein YyaC